MIRGTCFTNLDKASREKWPIVFAAVPRVDDYVRAEGGLSLRVVRVTHSSERDGGRRESPLLRIELHLPKGMSVSDFEGR